jgi:anti-sigma B factor antagonist
VTVLVVDVDRHQEQIVIQPRGEVDGISAHSLAEALEGPLPACEEIVMDLSGVSFMDSGGLHVLIDLTNRCRAQRQAFRLTGVRGQPARLLDLVGLRDFLTVPGGVAVGRARFF